MDCCAVTAISANARTYDHAMDKYIQVCIRALASCSANDVRMLLPACLLAVVAEACH